MDSDAPGLRSQSRNVRGQATAIRLAALLAVIIAIVVMVSPPAGAQTTTTSAVSSSVPTTTTVAPPASTSSTATPPPSSSTSSPPTSSPIVTVAPSTTTTVRATTSSSSSSTTTPPPRPAGEAAPPPPPGPPPAPGSPAGTTGSVAAAPAAGPVPFPTQTLSSPGAHALIESVQAFVAHAGRLRADIAGAEATLDGLRHELDQRRDDRLVADATLGRLRSELAPAEAELTRLQAQRRDAVRPSMTPTLTIPHAETERRRARVEQDLAERVGSARLPVAQAERAAEDARRAEAATADELALQEQALASLREELAHAPSEADVAAGLAALGDGRDGPRPSAFALSDIPGDYLDLYRRAAPRCPGLPWTVLAGIGSAESSHGRSTDPGVRDGANFAGAMGPMQFLADTWKTYGGDGDGDGVADVYNAADATASAADYLCASGAPDHLASAVWAYNHADWYVAAVLSRALAYGSAGLGTTSQDTAALVASPNLTATDEARTDLLSGTVDPHVVAALAAAAADHRIEVSVIRTGHAQLVRGTDRVSNHFEGRAVDITSVDGAAVSASNQAALHLALAFLTADPSLRPDELGSPWPELGQFPGAFSDSDHADHLHLGWRANPPDLQVKDSGQ